MWSRSVHKLINNYNKLLTFKCTIWNVNSTHWGGGKKELKIHTFMFIRLP